MFRKLLGALGIGGKPSAVPGDARPPYAPYRDSAANSIYNLLFCDDRSLYQNLGGPVVAERPDAAALRAVADDAGEEARVRVLAYNRLREMGEPVSAKVLLGVVVEVGLDDGLDVMAAFVDGETRYINHTGRMSFFVGSTHVVEAQVQAVIAAARPVVAQIGPWNGVRLPPPPRGMARLSFLVSDGLYFGQGPFTDLLRDPMAGPLLVATQSLLQRVVDASLDPQNQS